ncbi:ABC transporter substrate-binding protein [Verrucomicrobiaceae bacterium R5-34]|nr:ABC transporter substrate-binding protein [Verrucomicrobiaceae bacterium R5-34]
MSKPTHPRRYKGLVIMVVAVVAIFAASHWWRQSLDQAVARSYPPSDRSESTPRIVALSPSAVEIIYQLDLAEQLVGVSRFCQFPPEVSSKPVVGGYLDLDFEALLQLEPDHVVLLVEQESLAQRLQQLGIETVSVDHTSTTGIIDSIEVLGSAFGKEDKAQSIVRHIRERVQQVRQQYPAPSPPPRVLVCISRDTSSAHPDRIIAAGNAGVHQEYITMAGGRNAYRGAIAYPSLSREKLIQINPDVIIDLIPEKVWEKADRDQLLQAWSSYSELKAVQNQRIVIIHQNQHHIPGPRFPDTLEAFAQAISPK